MELLFEASLFSIILSVAIGILIAFLVVRKWQFPKNNRLFFVTIFLNLLSPFIGQSAYLIGFSDSATATASAGDTWEFGVTVVDGPLEGIIVAYLLTSFFLTVNIMYILRKQKRLTA